MAEKKKRKSKKVTVSELYQASRRIEAYEREVRLANQELADAKMAYHTLLKRASAPTVKQHLIERNMTRG